MKIWKKIAIGAFGLMSLITASSSYFVVDQSEQAVITRFGKPKAVVLNPIRENETTRQIKESYQSEGIRVSEGAGLHFKVPFIDSVTTFDRRMLRWDGYPEEIPTKDKKYLHTDTTARFCIEDPLKFLRTVSTEEAAHARLDDVVDAATRDAITNRNLTEVVRTSNRKMDVAEKELEETVRVEEISEGREKIAQEICTKSAEVCTQYGLRIHPAGYLMRNIVYVDEVKTKVEERMVSERMRVASRYKSEGEGEYQNIMGDKEKEQKTIVSEAERKAREILGGGEAQAVQIYADTYNRDPGFYRFLKTLELYEKALPKTTRIVIGTDNLLMGLLKGETGSSGD